MANKPKQLAEPCPKGITKEAMGAISAPYDFVPLANWVHIPAWGQLVSHDHPFRDGLSGEIAYALTATSPLLVGGEQTKAQETRPGEVKPFRLPDGRYAIAGSSLKGMIRSVIEIAGFGRMRTVDNARPGLRDISRSDSVYAKRVRGNVKTGFLHRNAGGDQWIVPCKMGRLYHRDLEKYVETAAPIFPARTTVAQKYKRWEELCRTRGLTPAALRFNPGQPERDVSALGTGSIEGVPVFTGQISDSTRDKGKQRDFVFYDCDTNPNHSIPVPDESWRDFLLIHGNDIPENAAGSMSWPGYWRARFQRDLPVPVFYLQDGDYLRIGLAYMPKLAGDYSIHDLIDRASPAHRQAPGAKDGYDLADLLFGAVNSSRQADALRGRVSFETAVANGTPREHRQSDTILNGPKPTYFPNYLSQKGDAAKGTLGGGQYATYIDTGGKPPTLRGFKRYPARPEAMTHVQALTGEQQTNNKVKIRLHTLEDAAFTGRIVFHNLKREELGALLWALTWDGNPDLRHGLGMGKSFGFGQVHIDIDATSPILPNDPARESGTLDAKNVRTVIDAFKAEMEEAGKAHGGWETSPQIANLLAMADPAAANEWSQAGRELRHMHLIAKCKQPDGKTGVNEFQWAKQKTPHPFVLADYAAATGWGKRWRAQVQARDAEAERIAAEERAEAEARAIEQETKNMPKDEAELFQLERDSPWKDNGQFVQAMEAYLEGRATLSTPAHDRLTRLIERRLPRLLANPHAKKGRKQKPVFSANQIALAERVSALQGH